MNKKTLVLVMFLIALFICDSLIGRNRLKHITLEKLPNSQTKKVETWTMVVTGDVMLGRTVNTQTHKYNDFTWAFSKTADILKNADLTFINLESPLAENCPLRDEGMIFCGSKKHAEGLKFSGIDVASLANNHSMNYGQEGLKDTIEALDNSQVIPVGVTNPVYKYVKGIKIALLGYDDIECYNDKIACADPLIIQKDVYIAKKNSDLIIIMFHWGNEYTSIPSTRQKELAHLAIDAGADLILGNHPHWIQPEEKYKEKLIVYSHGNFIFDQMWSQKTREGIIGKYTFSNSTLVDYEFIPVFIEDYGQPKIK